MIPLGNWADRIDELEEEVHDLTEELGQVEEEIADYLFEIDHLRTKKTELELDVEGLLALVEYWQEKAAGAEKRAQGFEDSAWRYLENWEKTRSELMELKAALRTLGGEREN